jgi:hypothetical protein
MHRGQYRRRPTQHPPTVGLGFGFDCNNCPFAGLGLDIKGALKQPGLLLNPCQAQLTFGGVIAYFVPASLFQKHCVCLTKRTIGSSINSLTTVLSASFEAMKSATGGLVL